MRDVDSLVNEMMKAHLESALNNDNLSSSMVRQMSLVGKTFSEAVASAVLSLGGIHGPVAQARQVLFNMSNDEILADLRNGLIIPGFGNSFHKDGIDPAWTSFHDMLESDFPEFNDRINEVAELISKEKGKKLHPNPAVFTAVVAELLNLFPGTEISLPIVARMPAWTQQWYDPK